MEETTHQQQSVGQQDGDQAHVDGDQSHVDEELSLVDYSVSLRCVSRRIESGPGPPVCFVEPNNTPQNDTQYHRSEPDQPMVKKPIDSVVEGTGIDKSKSQNNVESTASESLQSIARLQGEGDPKPKQPNPPAETSSSKDRDACTSESRDSLESKRTNSNQQLQPDYGTQGEKDPSLGKGDCTPPNNKPKHPDPPSKTNSPLDEDVTMTVRSERVDNEHNPLSNPSDVIQKERDSSKCNLATMPNITQYVDKPSSQPAKQQGDRVASAHQDGVAIGGLEQMITNGVKLKLKESQKPFSYFTYTRFPLMDKSVPVEWTTIVTKCVQSQHIHCHELLPEDDLAMLVADFKQAHAKAVILINTQENYSIVPQFLKGMKRSNFPIIILTKDDGTKLLKALKEHRDHGVLACIDAESDVDVKPPSVSRNTKALTFTETGAVRFGPDRHSTIDLKSELTSLMFSDDGKPVVICRDQRKFKKVIATFSNYEMQKAKDFHPDIDDEALETFYAHLKQKFTEDFPFYLLLVFRMHSKRSLYGCDTFILAVLNKLETMNYKKLATTFNAFIKGGDFQVSVIGDPACETMNVSVFSHLESACLNLSDVIQEHAKPKKQDGPRQRMYCKKFCYTRMMWISLALKLHHEGIQTPFGSIWHDQFICPCHDVSLDKDRIKDITQGLELGRLLQLPQDLCFNCSHMTDLLVSERCIRPFKHVKNYIHCLQKYLDSNEDVYSLLLIVRENFTSKFREPNFATSISSGNLKIGETLGKVISEGIAFLDSLSKLYDRPAFDTTFVEGECTHWLKLLLDLVDITKDHPEVVFKEFLRQTDVLEQHHDLIVKHILNTVKKTRDLKLEQFYPLYKSFQFWPSEFLQQYLKDCHVHWSTKINESTHEVFLGEVVNNNPGAHKHFYLVNYLQRIAQRYKSDRCQEKFVEDLFRLRVPELFAVADYNSNDGEVQEAKEVQKKFRHMLANFIKDHRLQRKILTQMISILNDVSKERCELQLLILTVLQQEVIPEFINLLEIEANTGNNGQVLRAVFKYCIDHICEDLHVHSLTPKQTFCWGLVASCCSRVCVVPDDFEWLYDYSYVITELSGIFRTYCTGKKLSEEDCIIVKGLPENVLMGPSDVNRYFEWIREVQSVLHKWQTKFTHSSVSYVEILVYAKGYIVLENLSHAVCATSLVIDFEGVDKAKNTFLTEYEMLNVYLILYVPQHPDAKWCTFPALLNEYGVTLPQNLLSLIQKYIVFPKDENATGGELLTHPLPAGTNGLFQPGYDVSLKLSKNLSLKELSALVQDLDQFRLSLITPLGMLIFFNLNSSAIFDRCLRFQIQQISEEEAAEESSNKLQSSIDITDSAFQYSLANPSPIQPAAPKEQLYEELSLKVLLKSAENTQKMLHKIMKGEATYFDIIPQEELVNDLEKLDVEQECSTLKDYFMTLCHSQVNFEGLDGIRSLLQLFQYTKRVRNIHNVCKQYHLERCLCDPQLKELETIVSQLESEANKSELTLNEASQKMKRVKELLCMDERTSSHCLDVFGTVADSAAFYHFVRDKQFHIKNGAAVFRQQYQLITAQLQHEEYDESVLNHLPAAIKVITPFMKSKQTFSELMTKVTSLDTTIGLKPLETVNGNITLIRLWFSRAEGDTIENVAETLQKVVETGYFTFIIFKSSEAQILLEYISSTVKSSPQREIVVVDAGPPSFGRKWSSISEQGLELVKRTEKWTSGQIADFVRKLGFIDTKKEGGEKIKHFRHISEIANKLLKLYGQLKDLGNPRYFKGTIDPLPCSIGSEAADHRVHETVKTLESWRSQVAEIHRQYDWLLFFSIPKILRLYKMLSAKEQDSRLQLDKIVHEISFLCKNDKPTREELGRKVQLELGKCLTNTEDPPIWVVGKFLTLLFTNHKLPTCLESSSPHHRSLTGVSLSQSFTQLLHSCPGFTQGQLIQTVIGICSGVPEAFEVLHCCATTTERELTMFLMRAAKHCLRSLVLEVNRLPFKLQESLIQHHLSIQQDIQDRKGTVNGPTVLTPCIHFIETAPSVLRDVSWIQFEEHKEPSVKFEKAQLICMSRVGLPVDIACIELVFGGSGDGKTHYINEQIISSPTRLTIAVNEAFTPLKAISKLRTLPPEQLGVSIFFNFTMFPPADSGNESKCEGYQQLIEEIGWFFFDLLILRYVEDPVTGKSFRIPGGLQWAIYIEVPSRDRNMTPGEALKLFCDEVPALGLLGTQHFICPEMPYTVDNDVQLVCKYLKALKKGGRIGIDRLYREGHALVKFSLEPAITHEQCQKLLQEYMPAHIKSSKVTQKLFVKYMKRRCQFLDRLPAFNYNTGSGEYSRDEQGERIVTNTEQLGSTLMNAMLKEVSDFCGPDIKKNWSEKPHQQLIYDYKDNSGSLGLISLRPAEIPEADKEAFRKIGVKFHSIRELHSRPTLDRFLSRALSIELESNRLSELESNRLSELESNRLSELESNRLSELESNRLSELESNRLSELESKRLSELKSKRLTAIDDSAYVLTLDYTIKMLNIHERYECGVPVIIEGETGVGKTALIEMLSKLWNQSLLLEWKKQRGRIVDIFKRKMADFPEEHMDNYQACFQTVHNLSAEKYCDVSEDTLLFLCQLPDGSHERLHSAVQKQLKAMRNDPVVAQLTLNEVQHKDNASLEQLFVDTCMEDTPEKTAKLLHAVLIAQVMPTFYKINVHAAMTPADIQNCVTPIIDQAERLKTAYENSKQRHQANVHTQGDHREHPSVQSDRIDANDFNYRMPFVTVFFDEVNTSSCVGLFKEIIVDRTFDGTPIPENVFIIAACNPHRGNSMASLGVRGADKEKEKWVRGTYYVRKLHPTLQFLMWDYGSLDEQQEREYINAKMKMLNHLKDNPVEDAMVANLTDLIVESQKQMRTFAYEQISMNVTGVSPSEAQKQLIEQCSHSCVSQRDIQRVFTLYQWFMKIYNKMKPFGERSDYNKRAVLVSLGIVYYMRLNNTYRSKYSKFLDSFKFKLLSEVTFIKAFEQELNWYINKVELPKGIARTQALKENIFATIVCTVTHTPLIIVGAPGSSKTLSFNQTIANLKGAESRVELFRDTTIFHSLDPHYYQCSRRTTSTEIQTVFSRAVNRQISHSQSLLPIHCVVFMDEAGLPEESHEPLKVLHYHLDKREVSFVAITNHVLDAAKTNRAISLFRPEASNEDLRTLAKGCLCSNPENPPTDLKEDLKMVVEFCERYSTLMERTNFARFFGLRDFIQFVNYLRRKRDDKPDLTPQVVMHALERNFNGSEDFETICSEFLGSNLSKVQCRGILDILRDSLEDRPQAEQDFSENEVRYKLIIDPSEDDSLVRLLFSFGILKRDSTRIFVCSNFPGDGQLQKINTIAAIRHSAIEGHTVVMSQTDDIHESFYDLFNQRFRRIDDPKEGPRYYTNIAIGAYSKPSRVQKNFQCVVVVKKSEVKNIPAPFLNRFEKYFISHHAFLKTALERMPSSMESFVKAAMEKVQDFISLICESDSLYGFCPNTLSSLILTLLPSVDHAYEELGDLSLADNSEDIISNDQFKNFILQESLQALRKYSGFFIPKYPVEEFNLDVESVFDVILQEPKFKELLQHLTHSTALKAITQAINALYFDVSWKDQPDISPESFLIIALLQQWLVRHICKRIMQLMTPEALMLHRNKIPYTYLQNYLEFQTHFNLGDLIQNYHKALKHTMEVSATCHSSNKILCFTRSSPTIHFIPSEYPSSDTETRMNSEWQQCLEDYVYEKTDKLLVCKISHIISQSKIEDVLKDFLKSETAEVCLLVVDMQRTSKEIVNHVRIMIEEHETCVNNSNAKTFVILLHFPPVQFFQPCYSSLFLQGWDHYYLDTIAQPNVKGVVDVCNWFGQCCFPQQSPQIEGENDTLLKSLQEMLPEAIPILASRVLFGNRRDGSFNSTMNGFQHSVALIEQLFEKGTGESKVYNLLCKKFRSYWKPSVMEELLKEAVDFKTKRESTLSITQSLQTRFKTCFFNFLAYMISQINQNFNIDILFDSDCTPDIEALFLGILEVFPVPKFSQISLLSHQLSQPESRKHTPRFPFFQMIYQVFEEAVEKCKKAVYVQFDILDEMGTPVSVVTDLHTKVISEIEQKREGFSFEAVQLVVKSIAKNEKLWSRYFGDFVLYKLQLGSEEKSESIGYKILYHVFETHKVHGLEALQRVVSLHCYAHVHHLNLAKMVPRLRPLNELQKLHMVEQRDSVHPVGSAQNLATWIITTFFESLVEITNLPDTKSLERIEKMIKWFEAYRDVMCLPDSKHYILSYIHEKNTGSNTAMEVRLRLVQTVFCVLQTSPVMDDVISKGLQEILNTSFDLKSLTLKEEYPRFADVVNTAIGVVSPNDSEGRGKLLECLFSHIFSPERFNFKSEDNHWFLELANRQMEWSLQTLEDQKDIPGGAVSMNVFKLYLGRILGQCNQRSDTEAMKSGPLLLYYHPTRTVIGNVLSASPDLGPPGPYIPKFYQNCPSIKIVLNSVNARMQQPLAHLYFLTVLEHLMSESHKLSILLQKFKLIHRQATSQTTCDRDRVILWIELQAVIQVTAQQLALHLDPSKLESHEVLSVLNDINKIMDDESTGGGRDGGHGMVVALHLYKECNSSRQFSIKFIKLYDALFRDINCLQPFHEHLKATTDSKNHLFPFMLPDANGELATLYRLVLEMMTKVHHQRKQVWGKHSIRRHKRKQVLGTPDVQAGLEKMQQTARTCINHRAEPTTTSTTSTTEMLMSDSGDRLNLFTMMVWLVSYYEFFVKKIPSKCLCDIIGHPEMSPYLKEERYIRLIQCFLIPDQMLIRKDVSHVLSEEQSVLEHTSSGVHTSIGSEGVEIDLLYDLFDPKKLDRQDQSDTDLRHSLANMIAVTLGCPSHSNHLWYHMFAQEELLNTYITGFMYNTKVSPESLLYDCGVELTAEGEIGRQDYNEHAGRGTYTLHSLYLLLWSNFGAFCMALLTQPDADAKIHGPIISKQQSIRHYCLSKLRSFWKCITINLGLNEEERTHFIRQSMFNLYQLLQTCTIVKDSLRGVFKTREELDGYERMWHICVYKPAWNELEDEFTKCSQLVTNQQNLFTNLRCLEFHYPHFPSEAEFVSGILNHGELEQHCEGGELRLLSQFAQGWKRLQAGGLLLPDLIEFYQWLHRHLAHIVSYERTTTLSISKVVHLAARRYGSPMGEYIVKLFECVKKGYNDYVDLIGVNKQQKKLETITDDTPLLYFLSVNDAAKEEKGNDLLFTVIAEIVTAHNMAIKAMYTVIQASDQSTLARLLPEQPAQVLPTEVNQHNCLTGKSTSLLQVIRSRYNPPILSSTEVPHGPRISFSLKGLEEDIVVMFVAGKHLIVKLDSLRTPFCFKQSQMPTEFVIDKALHDTMNLEEVQTKLADLFRKVLHSDEHRRLQYEFHVASYDDLFAVITALQTVCGYLVKVTNDLSPLADEVKDKLSALTLPKFMLDYVYKHLTDPNKVLAEIGITPNSLKHSQLTCLIELPLPYVFSCLQQFVKWIDEGVYDFCTLPFALKTHMTERDSSFIKQKLRRQWTGSHGDLVKEVKQLIEVLKHLQDDITKVDVEPQKPIVECLKDYEMDGAKNKLSRLIPKTILFQHFVDLRLTLRRLALELEREDSPQEATEESPKETKWSEYVDDLYQRLPHLAELEIYSEDFVYDLSTELFGFQEGVKVEGEDDLEHDLSSDIHMASTETLPSTESTQSKTIENKPEDEQSPDTSGSPGHEFDDEGAKLPDTEESVAARAMTYTPELVGEFLTNIGLAKYREPFVSEEIDGKTLLNALRGTKKHEFLTELEVEVALDRVRIGVLFLRELHRAQPKCPVQALVHFLKEKKLGKHAELFERNEIDGDMMLAMDPELMHIVLDDIGIKSEVQKQKIIRKFETFGEHNDM